MPDAGHQDLAGPPTGVGGKVDGKSRQTVVGATHGDDLAAPGVLTGQLDRVFHRFGAAEPEVRPGHAGRRDLGQQLGVAHGMLMRVDAGALHQRLHLLHQRLP